MEYLPRRGSVLRIDGKLGFAGFSDSTPLHLASAKGHDAIVRLLLDCGATIDRRDENGKTALDLAIENGHRYVLRTDRIT